MSGENDAVQFNWSVWDNSSTVSWTYNGKLVNVSLAKPPVSITNLLHHSLIAIVGSYDDLGSANLLLYTYHGGLNRTLVAPQLGSSCRFGKVAETLDGVSAVIGFYDASGWVEREGTLNLEEGSIEELHRSY